MTSPISLLLPRPKRVRSLDRAFEGSDVPVVRLEGDWQDDGVRAVLLARLGSALRLLTRQPWLHVNPDDAEPRVRLVLLRAGKREHGQSYRLKVDDRGIEIEAYEPSGLFYGLVTLEQWVKLHARDVARFRTIPGISVEDSPDFRYRGLMLDVSRNRVPRMDFLESLIDRMALLKINQLQLYMEHTFAYRGHEVVWEGYSPFTADEIRHLDRFCRERFIELVPNQNSFGHMHRWLVHEPYRSLAECPEGIDHPFAHEREPFSLCPTDPAVLTLLEDLYDQLLPNFTSRQFNVGLDETFDLGQGRSAEACQKAGTNSVYLDFLRQVHRRVEERGHRMQFWGDIIIKDKARIADLPVDAIALEWGYEADHPFADHARAFADSGLEFYVCPGTSSWNSLLGRLDNAAVNLEAAARHGERNGATGYLITDWGDFGHLQPPVISYPGLLIGAAHAWSAEQGLPVERDPSSGAPADDEHLAALIAQHLLYDASAERGSSGGPAMDGCRSITEASDLARRLLQLGRLYSITGDPPMNGSHLFFLLLFADQSLQQRRFAGLTIEGLESAASALEPFRASESAAFAPSGGLAERELAWAAAVSSVGARLGLARLAAGREVATSELAASERRPLRRELVKLDRALPELWQSRSRIGGLSGSRHVLQRVIDRLA